MRVRACVCAPALAYVCVRACVSWCVTVYIISIGAIYVCVCLINRSNCLPFTVVFAGPFHNAERRCLEHVPMCVPPKKSRHLRLEHVRTCESSTIIKLLL